MWSVNKHMKPTKSKKVCLNVNNCLLRVGAIYNYQIHNRTYSMLLKRLQALLNPYIKRILQVLLNA